MAEEKKESKTEPKSKFRQAVDWAAEQSMKTHGGTCGVCGFRPWDWGSDDKVLSALTAHIRRKHHSTIVDLFDKDTLDLSFQKAPASDSEDELLAVAGIQDVQNLDRVDLLEIPEPLRKQAELDGAVFYWKRKEEVEHLKSQGAELVYTNGHAGSHQHSTEDGVLRSRELVCMRLPHELAVKRRRQKNGRIDDQLHARAEEVRVKKDEYEKRTYDYLRGERNLDHAQADRIAKVMTGRRQRESNIGMRVQTRHGVTEV